MVSLTDYHKKLFATELTLQAPSDSIDKFLPALTESRIQLNPHQIEASLFAFASPFSRGALLADEVGLGKTIEAGLVIAQKWAERKRRILVILPSNLRKQWNLELLDKFGLPSFILESQTYERKRKEGSQNPFQDDSIVLCSYQFVYAHAEDVSRISWDLVVIDEAHRLRNVYKTGNKMGPIIRDSVQSSPKILLTATPLQNSLAELYGLITIIDPYAFGDLQSFRRSYIQSPDEMDFADLKERLRPYYIRTLRRQVLAYIRYTSRSAITQDFYPTENETRLYNMVSEFLTREGLHSLPVNQRHLMILVLRKLLASSTFAIAGTFDTMIRRLQEVGSEQSGNISETFPELSQEYEGLSEREEEWGAVDEEIADDQSPEYEAVSAVTAEIELLKTFRDLARGINHNAKGEVLVQALQRGFQEMARLGANRKAIIFTESTRTQEYIERVLRENGFIEKIVLFNGSNADQQSKEIYQAWLKKYQDTDRVTGSKSADMRSALVDYFREEAEVMIATEAAAEGINLQFCSLVVSYDLPWNPQRIEQRIGRCHRYGQKHDVVVVNFVNRSNEADQRVYELLNEKFRLFDGVFGASDEVLGAIESGVDFEKRIARIYQECRTPAEINASFELLQQELEDQIQDRMASARKTLLENFDEEVHERLQMRDQDRGASLNRYHRYLWRLLKSEYGERAICNDESMSLQFAREPVTGIPAGEYGVTSGARHQLFLHHPLVEPLLNRYRSIHLPVAVITFHYTESPLKITILEKWIGKGGVLSAELVHIVSADIEEKIIWAGITADGESMGQEECKRLFSLGGEVTDSGGLNFHALGDLLERAFEEGIQAHKKRNMEYFSAELDKLDRWGDDKKKALDLEQERLDGEIRLRKNEARIMLDLQERVKAERTIKEMERKRSEIRRNYFQSTDEVEERKEALIRKMEESMRTKITRTPLFSIGWRLV